MHKWQCSLSMPMVFYFSIHMPIGWEGLSMPTDGCSLCVPISLLILSTGVLNRTVPYMAKVILTHIPAECGVVDPYVDRFLNASG